MIMKIPSRSDKFKNMNIFQSLDYSEVSAKVHFPYDKKNGHKL